MDEFNIRIEISVEDVEQESKKKGKNEKATDPGGINMELLKYGSREVCLVLTKLINTILKWRKMPDEMRIGYTYI